MLVATPETIANPTPEATAKPNGFLKPVSVTQQQEGVQLEKPRPVLIAGGDLSSLQETIAAIKKEKGADFNACVLILPLFEGMPTERVMRTRKLKDAKGIETGEIEEYESLQKFADTTRVNLTAIFGLAPDPERPLFAGMTVYDRPKKSATSDETGINEEAETETE